MSAPRSTSRRRLLQEFALIVPLAALAARRTARADAAPQPLLDTGSVQAKALKYVANAKDAAGASQGSSCANCALYQGTSGSAQGPCQLFPGKDVKASGWCSSWAVQM
ncbi:MAG: high-potential iron-sulfur protein [Steroidobacteraceae bacterium]